MVTIYDAYKAINSSILRVINDTVDLTLAPIDEKPVQFRLIESPFDVTERYDRLGEVVVAHNLLQYTNKFYGINVRSKERCLFDILIDLDRSTIDLTEFGGDYAIASNYP